MFDKMPKTKKQKNKTLFLYPKFVERGNRNRTSVSLNGMNPNLNLKPNANPEPQKPFGLGLNGLFP